jgi:hypothetical protein
MNDQTQPAQMTPQQRQAIAKAKARLRLQQMGQPAAPAAPSLRSETDAIIEEAAAAIPGGYEAFIAKPPNAERMRAMGYVPDPLASASTGGFSRPRAQPQQVTGPLTGDTSQPNVFTDVMRGLEAPIAGLTGGRLEGWAKTTTRDPVRGAVEAVEFISPVDEAGRAYLGLRDAGAGLIEGDMGKAAQGAQQASIQGSYAALQMLPGSMTLRGMAGPRNALAPTTLAGAERAAVQATRAPPVGKAVAQAAAPQPQPAPFSAPAEPKPSSFLRNNADRIVGGGVGAFAGSAGDAFAASGGDGNGGPDIINPVTGAAAGVLFPRAAMRGYRAAGSAIRGGGFNEAVAVRAARNALAPAGRSADEIRAANLAQFGDKPAPLANLTQNAQNISVGLSRQPGVAAELASEQVGDLARTRTGRLFSDVQATTKIDPATVTGDIDAAIKQASEEISPAYEKLFADNAGVNSERLMQLADDPVVGPYVRRAIQASESLQTTAGQAPSNARIWDLVKRGLDRTIESQKRSGGQAAYELEKARGAIKDELDALMPDYKAVRDGADAPRMREARKQGAQVAGGGLSVEKVRAIASGLTGKPLTALQMGTVEKIVLDIEKGRGIDGLSSERMRQVFSAVFDQQTADELTARIRADQTMFKNAQRRDPDFGSATSQAGMADRGLGAAAADAFRAVRSPVEAALAALSRSGAYTQDQRNRIAEMLYGGATPENLARIYGNRPPRNALNVEPPPTPQGPPTNALAPRVVAGAAAGGVAGGLGGIATAQEADANNEFLGPLAQERERIKGLEAELDIILNGTVEEKQAYLAETRGLKVSASGRPDGNLGPDTRAAIQTARKDLEAAINEGRDREKNIAGKAEQRRSEIEMKGAFDRTKPDGMVELARELGPWVGIGAGVLAGALMRKGAVNKTAAQSATRAASLNRLLSDATPTTSDIMTGRKAMGKRATNLNEFFYQGGAGKPDNLKQRVGLEPKQGVPFMTDNSGDWMARPNAKDAFDLFKPETKHFKMMDMAVIGASMAESEFAGNLAKGFHEEAKQAQAAVDKAQAEGNAANLEIAMARLESAKNAEAAAIAFQRFGQVAALARTAGAFKMPYEYTRPNVKKAQADQALILDAIRRSANIP